MQHSIVPKLSMGRKARNLLIIRCPRPRGVARDTLDHAKLHLSTVRSAVRSWATGAGMAQACFTTIQICQKREDTPGSPLSHEMRRDESDSAAGTFTPKRGGSQGKHTERCAAAAELAGCIEKFALSLAHGDEAMMSLVAVAVQLLGVSVLQRHEARVDVCADAVVGIVGITIGVSSGVSMGVGAGMACAVRQRSVG